MRRRSLIFLISPPFRPNVGGVETHLDDLISAGEKRNYDFVVLTYQPLVTLAKGKIIEKAKNFIIYRIPWLRMNLFLLLEKYPALEFIYLFPGLFIGAIFVILKYKKISKIHAQGIVAGTIGVLLGKLFNLPVIISTHSIYNFPDEGIYKKFVKFIFNNSDHILTLSKQSQKEIISLGLSKNKVSTFTYWVNHKIFKKISKFKARKKLKIDQKKFICLFVGRLLKVKGIKVLLKAVSKSEKGINFLIVGDGPLEYQIAQFEKSSSRLKFAGKIDNDKLPVYYNAADVLIVPSIQEEGFGRVIVEALSCGLPVIGSNRGGIKEALTGNEGLLIKITPENIATALNDLYFNQEKLKKLSENSLKFARDKFGERNCSDIFKHYE